MVRVLSPTKNLKADSVFKDDKHDILVDGQKTYADHFKKSQNALSSYLGNLDVRLSKPKHTRKRVLGEPVYIAPVNKSMVLKGR